MDNFNEKDVIIMKMLHYFITECNYNPVILHGAENEIWLENMDSEYKIIRIVSKYIHNNEQLSFDIFKTRKIAKSIKRKTFNFSLNVLSIYIDLGDYVELHDEKDITMIYITKEEDFKKYKNITSYFKNITKKLEFNEEGINLFIKITEDINKNNKKKSEQVDKIFSKKTPYITYILMGINIFMFLLTMFMGNYMLLKYGVNGNAIRSGEYYRLITGGFLHGSILHLLCNMYALYVLGSQAESFYGKVKYFIIYLGSLITGSLLSMLFNLDGISIGASGAIFGLLGSLLYFGYNYRVYLGNTLVNQILPVILINLMLGFVLAGVDNFGHIGGLAGGLVLSMALGVSGKNNTNDRVNGIIFTIMYIGFLIFMNFIR